MTYVRYTPYVSRINYRRKQHSVYSPERSTQNIQLFCAHVLVVTQSLSEDDDGRRPYCKLVAGVLRDMGVLKCQLGEMAAGCQLLNESAGLYQWMPRSEKVEPSTQDVINTAEVSTPVVSLFREGKKGEGGLLFVQPAKCCLTV